MDVSSGAAGFKFLFITVQYRWSTNVGTVPTMTLDGNAATLVAGITDSSNGVGTAIFKSNGNFVGTEVDIVVSFAGLTASRITVCGYTVVSSVRSTTTITSDASYVSGYETAEYAFTSGLQSGQCEIICYYQENASASRTYSANITQAYGISLNGSGYLTADGASRVTITLASTTLKMTCARARIGA